MPYPFWDGGVAYGPLMAVIAVLHVFVSHFAIGGGLYLVVAEGRARRRHDEEGLAFVRSVSRFFVLATVVFGALSGVAIWFVIGLLSPNATELLIHNFVWAWGIEWTFFIVEILSAILYFLGWKRMSARDHMALGWVYFVMAFLTLLVINGIVSFMLTPGDWIRTGGFWDGFLNPTYWPSLVLRTGVAILLAGVFTLALAAWRRAGAFKARLVRFNALWALVGLVAAGGGWFWYESAIGDDLLSTATTRLPIAGTAMHSMVQAAIVLALVVLVVGLLLPRLYGRVVGLVVLLLALVAFGGFEWFREAARKPYVAYGYMYGNGIRADRAEAWSEGDGLLAHAAFRTSDEGTDLYRMACETCHTPGGYSDILPKYAHTDPAFIESSLRGLHEMRGKMPPFPGNAEERKTLAAWIWSRVDQRPLAAATGLQGDALGKAAYARRCELCHERGGWKDPSDTIKDIDREGISDLISESLADTMPVWSGPDDEKQALIDYLDAWKKEIVR